MINRIAVIVSALLVLAGALVAADYYGWLMSRPQPYTDYVTMHFTVKDSATGELIEPVFAACVARGARHACTQAESAQRGVVALKFGLIRVRNRGLIFQHDAPPGAGRPARAQVMFIHGDYERKVETVNVNELLVDNMQRTVYLTRAAAGE